MGYQWDGQKDKANQEKHGVSFEQAAQIFDFPFLERPDPRDYGEPRFIATGRNRQDEFFTIVSTWRGGDRRIISAWRAGKHDRKAYRERFSEV